ncbi:LamG domain-containing protein [Patescibacteria group bacterium]|nr:LamG domain-containing protein [Patescibacteria group bacterium]
MATDEIEVADTDLFTFGDGSNDSPFSISLWANFGSITFDIIMTKGGRTPGNTEEEYTLFIRNDVGLRLRIRDDSASVQPRRDGSTTLSTGTWYHIVATYDGSGGATAADGINLYVDASSHNGTATNNASYTAMSNDTAILHIGSTNDNNSSFKGKLDDVRIYNRVLSADEIKRLYDMGR